MPKVYAEFEATRASSRSTTASAGPRVHRRARQALDAADALAKRTGEAAVNIAVDMVGEN